MPSDAYGCSIRNLLFVIVFRLGICIVVLAAIADAVRGYSTLLPGLARLVGGLTALGALLFLYRLEMDFG